MLTISVAATAAGLVAVLVGAAPTVTVAVTIAVLVAGLWPVGGRPAAVPAGRRLVHVLRPWVPAAPLAAPRPVGPAGSPAVVWDSAGLWCGVGVGAAPVPRRPEDRPADPAVELADVVALLRRYDITVDRIDVLSTGSRPRGTGAVHGAYRSLLGPLPDLARRRVAVMVRIDPDSCPEAVARRGGGQAGAQAVARITAERLARSLTESGLVAEPLDTRALARLWRECYELPETALSAPVAAGWDRVRVAEHVEYCLVAEPEALSTGGLARAWSGGGAASTVTVTVRPGRGDEVLLSAVVRRRVPAGVQPVAEPGYRLVRGGRGEGLRATGPAALPVTGSLGSGHPMPATTAGQIRLPVTGSGVLLGGDNRGRPVTVDLAGPGTGTVHLAAETASVLRLIGRVIATGSAVLVRTDRPAVWESFLRRSGVGEQTTVTGIGADDGLGVDAVVYDGVPVPPALGSHHPGRIVVTAPHEDLLGTPVDLQIRQLPGAAELAITWPGGQAAVTAVAVPAENRLIGVDTAVAG